MSYTLIECDHTTDLEQRVNRYKALGWYCIGGPFIARTSVSGPVKWYQAMDSDKPVIDSGWQVGPKVSNEGSRKKWTKREKKVGNGQTP